MTGKWQGQICNFARIRRRFRRTEAIWGDFPNVAGVFSSGESLLEFLFQSVAGFDDLGQIGADVRFREGFLVHGSAA
jgi:hypothetical protein